MSALLVVAVLAPMGGCGKGRRTAIEPPPFEGEAALRWIDRQLSFGPRAPGTPAHEACGEALADSLRKWADEVRIHRFARGGVSGMNIVATFRPEEEERIFLGSHWDTRPVSDEDPDPARRMEPVPGANDGASGVAVLMTVAERMAVTPPPRGVDLFLFDAEDGGRSGDPDSWSLGAQALAEALGGYRPRMGIVVDMVGDADLRLPQEAYSLRAAPRQTRWLWEIARGLGESAFVEEPGPAVIDDHLPFLRMGIPAVLVIDLDYPWWHTTGDDRSRVSAASLESVGRVVMAAVYAETLP